MNVKICLKRRINYIVLLLVNTTIIILNIHLIVDLQICKFLFQIPFIPPKLYQNMVRMQATSSWQSFNYIK